nr:uncharacterized protein LOC114819996 [Malus domestica]
MACMHAVEPRGRAGGMCVFWNDANDVVLVKYGDFFIEVLIQDTVRLCKWRLVIVYASTDEHMRATQLGPVQDRVLSYFEPCMVMGDLNDLLLDSENKGGNERTVASMRCFRSFVTQARLLDLGFVEYPFTWSNRQEDGFIQERLDRVFATHEWVQCYQQTVVKHVILEGSDHTMLVLSMEVEQSQRKTRFMYDPKWNHDKKCADIVRACCGEVVGGYSAQNGAHATEGYP